MSVFDLHVHTVKGSSDSSLSPAELIEEARRIGLDGVCLTEHGGGWDVLELRRVFEATGLMVVRGLEVATEAGHVLVFGVHAYVNGGLHRLADLRREVDGARGVMIAAHPFRNLFNRPPYNLNLVFDADGRRPRTAHAAAQHPLFRLVDEVEVANGSNTDEENRFCLEVADELGMRGTGGSDAHSTHGLGRCVTVFHGAVRSERDLIDAIRAGALSPGEGFPSGDLRPFRPEERDALGLSPRPGAFPGKAAP